MRKNTDVPCPKCGAQVGQMCVSLRAAQQRLGEPKPWPVEHVHAPRLHASIRNQAIKKAFQSLRDNQGQNQ